MGALHGRVVAANPDTEVAVVVDRDARKAEALAERVGSTASVNPFAPLDADAAIVATPPDTHFAVAAPLLEMGIPTLVEKPLTVDLAEAHRLIALAADRGVPLMCGFVERFNPVVRAAASHLDAQGPPIHIIGLRHSPPSPRPTLGVVHDLLIHDIDLVLHLTGEASAAAVGAFAWWPRGSSTAETTDCVLSIAHGTTATLSASRRAQRKVRELRIATEDTQTELDLLRRTMTIYRHVAHGLGEAGGYRAETVVEIPFVRQEGEPLDLQLRHLVELIRGERSAMAELGRILPAHLLASEVETIAVTGRALAGSIERSGPHQRSATRDEPATTVLSG